MLTTIRNVLHSPWNYYRCYWWTCTIFQQTKEYYFCRTTITLPYSPLSENFLRSLLQKWWVGWFLYCWRKKRWFQSQVNTYGTFYCPFFGHEQIGLFVRHFQRIRTESSRSWNMIEIYERDIYSQDFCYFSKNIPEGFWGFGVHWAVKTY